MLRPALICLGLLALILVFPLLLPGNGLWLIPALILAPFAPWLCVRLSRAPLKRDGWRDNADALRSEQPKTVCVEPAILIGQRWLQADVWMPFERTEGERFRSHSSAIALSAAIALTDEQVADENSVNGYTAHEIAEWETSLGIQAVNFRRNHPVLDAARYCGFPGVIAADGRELRAYFAGSAALIHECHTVLDGIERPLNQSDLEQAAALPANVLCYATGVVRDGNLSDVCFLGAVLPVARYSVSPDALAAGQELHRMGIRVTLNRSDPWALANARSMGIDWPDDEGEPCTLYLLAERQGPEQTRRFEAPVLELMDAYRQERYQCLLCALFGLVLWPSATLSAYPWPFLIALVTFCLTILISRGAVFPAPPERSPRTFLMPLIPGFLLPLIMWFFIDRVARETSPDVGACMVVFEGAVLAMWRLLLLNQTPKGIYTILIGGVICLAAVFGSVLLATVSTVNWVRFAFEAVAGILIGVAVIVSHRLLSPKELDEGSP